MYGGGGGCVIPLAFGNQILMLRKIIRSWQRRRCEGSTPRSLDRRRPLLLFINVDGDEEASIRFLASLAVSRTDLMSVKTRANFMKDHVNFKGEPPGALARNRHRIADAVDFKGRRSIPSLVLAAGPGSRRVIVLARG